MMSKLERLLGEYCPNGVPFSKLVDVSSVLPSGVDKEIKDNEQPVKLCNYMDVYDNQYITTELIQNFMDGTVNPREYDFFSLKKGQVLLTKDSETAEDIGRSTYITETFENVVCGYHLAVLTPNKDKLDGKFLNYLFSSQPLRNYFTRHANGVSRFGLTVGIIEKAPIPLPPLPVQQEIVRILDAFSQLSAELQSELQARKTQYDYYRNTLLNFNMVDSLTTNVFWMKLIEIAKRNHGTNITANKMKTLHKNNAPVRIFAGGSTIADVDYSDIPEKDVITETSVIVKSRGYIGFEYYEKPFSHKNEFWSYTFNETVNTKFIYYYLLTKTRNLQELAKATSVKLPQLSVANTDSLQVPIPPLAEQERIVAILDRFDTLVHDISTGLPAEIEGRRRQYEYYRDKLLTFKELAQ